MSAAVLGLPVYYYCYYYYYYCCCCCCCVIMVLEDTAAFQVLDCFLYFEFGTSLLWRSTVTFTYLKAKSAKCLCLLPVVLVLFFRSWSWSCMQRSWTWSCYFGLGLKNLVLFTSLQGMQLNRWSYPIILAYPKRSMLQITLALALVNRSSHTVPQVLFRNISTRPSRGFGPPTSRTTQNRRSSIECVQLLNIHAAVVSMDH